MIVTFTANPALDRTIELPRPIAPGEVQLAASAREDAAGKGVNVARVLEAAGADAVAVLPLAGDDPYRALLGDAVAVDAIATERRVRVNTTITDGDGATTKLNLPGEPVGEAEVIRMIDGVVAASEGAEWLALCGSLPPGAPVDLYARVARECRSRFSRPPKIAVDASGAALAALAAAAGDDGPVDLITPNAEELVDLLSDLERDGGVRASAIVLGAAADADASSPRADLIEALESDPVAVARACRALVPRIARAALVTLGGDGAVLVDADGARRSPVPAGIAVRSTVGAGDSALAGLLLADIAGATADDRLRSAIRHGSATAALPGTSLTTPDDLPAGELPVTPIA
ncbi:1-phosphofructokinase family hexose kinase [Microbacterium halophytorum]|uniref:1-phosphofructokinase family hexose kinase n=1 Tax=Microbacterium halophytorum TaxID=2067568 RepID=UPI000CFDEC3A|nr:hexose kinase [Microbacterium halophytorum]